MKYICIGLIILLYSFQTLFCKLFSDKYPGKNELVSLVFCIIQSIFITLTTYIRCHFSSVFLWNSFSSRNCNCIENFRYLHDAYCTLIKMQTIYHNEEKQSMIMITFTLMGFTAFINLFKKEKGSTLQIFKLNKKCLPSLILCLISATLAINLLMYILPHFPHLIKNNITRNTA